ncbi:MAG: hypothetical protein WA001_04275 [Patescibacteria group bacterium]
MMKKSFFVFGFALALFGAGCAWNPFAQPAPSPSGAASSTATGQTAWQAFSTSTVPFTFSYPPYAKVLPEADRAPDDVFALDLGSRVASSSAQSVPEAQLHVKLLQATDPDMKNCFYSESGWPSGFAPTSSQHVTLNGAAFCLTVDEDAGAGNYYNSTDYATQVGSGYVVFEFVVHSVDCQNYPNPSAQCVAFDELRDTADFKSIIQTFSPVNSR